MYFYTSTNESFVPTCKFITMPNLDVEPSGVRVRRWCQAHHHRHNNV